MDLSVPDRMSLLSILPPQGDITTLRIVRELREALSFDEQEHEALHLTIDGDKVTWDGAVDLTKDVTIGEKANDIIVAALKAKDHEKVLTESHLPLWDKFMADD